MIIELIKYKNVKKFFNAVNTSLGRNNRNNILIKSKNNNTILDDKSCSNEFAKFFQSTFTNDDGKIPEFKPKLNLKNFLDEIIINDTEIFTAINNLKASKSFGPDGLSAYFLKSVAPSIILPLLLLF
jgi:hypothetical protein